ncbi:hypothetical protein HPB49_001082 [Dermacentor silvarum]|uniref:Uncharacterized protein n=1 Tax=Dermacentor silvarum TaxID=543639 RepID=A0ACB8CIZ6_DERSI|nr:hypothetical protein HPB49_001082 [Dermacentor silvarum]
MARLKDVAKFAVTTSFLMQCAYSSAWTNARKCEPHSILIVWSPGPAGLFANEAVHAAACVSPFRAVTTSDSASTQGTSALAQYRSILERYRSSRRLYPDPARGLSKADERLLRRLQTNTFLCPAAGHHFMPGIHGYLCHSIPLRPTHKRGLGGVPAWLLYIPWKLNAPWWPQRRSSPVHFGRGRLLL